MAAHGADPVIGVLIDGRYQVTGRVARGGMATVYRATDQRLGRDVALKVMHPHLADDGEFVRRFAREARSAAKLSHPGIVSIYDQGNDNSTIYLAMEYVEGKTLRSLITELGALTPDEAFDIAEQVLDALAAAHRVGIVHRDIKPENIIITPEGRIKVADFGVARAVTDTSVTQTGTVLGTVAYLAPELVARGVADPRADLYACGIVLFEMLTGGQPFTGERPIQVAWQHVHDTVPLPSSRVPWLPPPIDGVVEALTAREPSERPADAGAALPLVQAVHDELDPEVLSRRPVVETKTPVVVGAQVEDTTARLDAGAPTRTGTRVLDALPPARAETIAAPPSDTDEPTPGSRHRRMRFVLTMAAVVLFAGAVTAWYFLAGPGSLVAVPNVVGQSQSKAESLLTKAGLPYVISQANDEKVAAGQVVSTKPAAQTKVAKDHTVSVVVSSGPSYFKVPTVTGKPKNQAETEITGVADAKFTVAYGDEQYSETVAEGSVVSQNPAGGSSQRIGTTITLVLSKGREPFEVPNVVGQTKDQATTLIESKNQTVGTVTEDYSDTVPAGSVISQDPAAGTQQHSGDAVNLVVSKGPEQVKVPNVHGKSIDDATQILQSAGFQVNQNVLPFSFWKKVTDQSPKAGDMAAKGSTVTITIS